MCCIVNQRYLNLSLCWQNSHSVTHLISEHTICGVSKVLREDYDYMSYSLYRLHVSECVDAVSGVQGVWLLKNEQTSMYINSDQPWQGFICRRNNQRPYFLCSILSSL
ncbi:hypothetical protein ABZX51_009273 [Aspergillus tubingensis]